MLTTGGRGLSSPCGGPEHWSRSRASQNQVPRAGSSLWGLCAPTPPVAARQLPPAAGVPPPHPTRLCAHVDTSEPIVCFCCPLFVTVSLMQIRVLLKPVFCV